VASALLYLVVALGVPLPAPQAAEKDLSQPFPCMFSQCGCRTAEECWRHCCCHSLAERLQWARENHVQPPDYVLAEARAAGIQWSDDEPRDSHLTCRSDGGRYKGCSSAAAKGSCCCCCSKCSAAENPNPNPIRKPDSKPHPRGVVLIAALACQGFGTDWISATISLPPPAPVHWTMAPGPVGRIEFGRDLFSPFSAPPPVPPPRSPAC